MALIKCIECGKDISDKASVCPSCGCPLAVMQTSADKVAALDISESSVSENARNKQSSSSPLFMIVSIILVILVLIILYLFYSGHGIGSSYHKGNINATIAEGKGIADKISSLLMPLAFVFGVWVILLLKKLFSKKEELRKVNMPLVYENLNTKKESDRVDVIRVEEGHETGVQIKKENERLDSEPIAKEKATRETIKLRNRRIVIISCLLALIILICVFNPCSIRDYVSNLYSKMVWYVKYDIVEKAKLSESDKNEVARLSETIANKISRHGLNDYNSNMHVSYFENRYNLVDRLKTAKFSKDPMLGSTVVSINNDSDGSQIEIRGDCFKIYNIDNSTYALFFTEPVLGNNGQINNRAKLRSVFLIYGLKDQSSEIGHAVYSKVVNKFDGLKYNKRGGGDYFKVEYVDKNDDMIAVASVMFEDNSYQLGCQSISLNLDIQ